MVRILDGANSGKTSTSGTDGRYSIQEVAGNMNVSVTADGYKEHREGFNVSGDTSHNFQLALIPALECMEVVSKSWKDGSLSGRTDFVDVRYVFRNSCTRRIRFHGANGPDWSIPVAIYDNLTRSGSPLGEGFFDPFEISENTTATVEDLVILDRGSISDIPGPDAIVLRATVSFVE